jgi:DNA polymerase-4
VGDLADLEPELVVAALGRAQGRHLHDLANGRDPRAVVPDRRPKSVGHEETFARDLHRRSELDRELTGLCDAVAARLRGHRLAGRTVTVKVRFGDFHTVTRSVTVAEALDEAPAVRHAAAGLLDGIDPSPGVRLLGVSVSGLGPGGVRQLTLDDVDGPQGWSEASRTIDEIRARFGADAIGPAALTRPDGLAVKGHHAQQWGPSSGADEGTNRPDQGPST